MTLLKDVDGTIPGRAVLVMVDLEGDPHREPNITHSLFYEGPRTPNPIQSCWALWESVRGDWPGYEATVVANARAKFLIWQRRMEATFGPGEYTFDLYLSGKDDQ